MPDQDLLLNRALVFLSAVVYWAGVFIQASRVRRRIGHSPNVKPRTPREKLLWIGWTLVVFGWLALAFLARSEADSTWLRIHPSLSGPLTLLLGSGLIITGYAGTLWCYAAMGSAWRMGVDRNEKTSLVRRGPYRFVRHPIYVFQALMLIGSALLLPAPVSAVIVGIHVVCIMAKAADEENYLSAVHGRDYADYLSRSGRFFPRLRPKSGPGTQL